MRGGWLKQVNMTRLHALRIQKTSGNLSTALLQPNCGNAQACKLMIRYAQVDFLRWWRRWQLNESPGLVVNRHRCSAPALQAAAEQLIQQSLISKPREALVLPDYKAVDDRNVFELHDPQARRTYFVFLR